MTFYNFWQLLAGLGIFLFGMFQLEDTLKQLAGRTFKLFLRKHTNNKLSAILSGALVTGVLQSSSVVTLMVLTFVGAGVISMRNALGVVFGANLGTTLSSWVMATLGFKFDIEKFAFPIIAVAGLGLIVFTRNKRWYHISKFSMGFGLLFLGLNFMKESFEVIVKDFDFAQYSHLSRLSFVFIGFIVTAIIQSSSATMVITLSALNTGAIPFETAASVIIGSELGTTIKLMIASIGGIASKKRIALGNIIFNGVIVLFAYLFMFPITRLIVNIIGANEPLFGLVMFQTIINLFGIILFFPILKHFGSLLERLFLDNEGSATYYIQNASPLVPEAALESLEKETLLFIQRVIHLNRAAFKIDDSMLRNENPLIDLVEKRDNEFRSYIGKYDNVKHAEGEILSLYTKMSEEKMIKEDLARLNQLIAAVRNAMYSAKGIKDIRHDKNDLRDSAIDVKYEQYQFLQSQLARFYTRLDDMLNRKEEPSCFKELVKLMGQIRKDYEDRLNTIYKQSEKETLGVLDISTLLNVNREVYSSCKAIIFSLRDYLFDASRAEEFDNVPLSIIK
jgi:phosphate:Na+ symporter